MGIEKPVYEAAMKGTPTIAPSKEVLEEVMKKTYFHERHRPFICSCCSFNIDPPKFRRTHVILVTKNIDLSSDRIYPATLCNECRQETDALDSLYRPHMSIDMNTVFRVEVNLEKTNVDTWVIRDNNGHPVYEKRTRGGVYEAAVDDNFEAVFGKVALAYEVVQ
tara:strand:+ start:675 stop:1166 length:492 start_codon:yes stop_codon:yes gene_type:complete